MTSLTENLSLFSFIEFQFCRDKDDTFPWVNVLKILTKKSHPVEKLHFNQRQTVCTATPAVNLKRYRELTNGRFFSKVPFRVTTGLSKYRLRDTGENKHARVDTVIQRLGN